MISKLVKIYYIINAKRQTIPLAQQLGQTLVAEAKNQYSSSHQLANALGVSRQTVFYWEKGRKIISAENMGNYLQVVKPDNNALDRIMAPFGELLIKNAVSLTPGISEIAQAKAMKTIKLKMHRREIGRAIGRNWWDNATEEQKLQWSIMHKKENLSEETRNKISSSQKGRHFTARHRKNLSKGQKRRQERERREREMTALTEYQIAS